MIQRRTIQSRLASWTSITVIAASLFLLPAHASAAAERPIDLHLDLDLYAQLLDEYTRATNDTVAIRVDYASIASEPRWKKIVSQVEAARPSRLEHNARIAYWINAYNILTIDLVAKHYPLDSIKDIGSFFSPVWDVSVATIEGKDISLGQIEHKILRPMGDPRIHAAIVCASTSCPPLARTPFRADRIDEDLSGAMRAWLSSQTKGVRIDREARRVRISKIFDWFEEDFDADGGVLETIAKYVDAEDAKWLRGEGQRASVRFFDYDWALNDYRR